MLLRLQRDAAHYAARKRALDDAPPPGGGGGDPAGGDPALAPPPPSEAARHREKCAALAAPMLLAVDARARASQQRVATVLCALEPDARTGRLAIARLRRALEAECGVGPGAAATAVGAAAAAAAADAKAAQEARAHALYSRGHAKQVQRRQLHHNHDDIQRLFDRSISDLRLHPEVRERRGSREAASCTAVARWLCGGCHMSVPPPSRCCPRGVRRAHRRRGWFVRR